MKLNFKINKVKELRDEAVEIWKEEFEKVSGIKFKEYGIATGILLSK